MDPKTAATDKGYSGPKNNIVITKKDDQIYYGYYRGGIPVELFVKPCEDHKESLLGNIYAARVERVAEGIQGAFLEIADGKCFYPLKQAQKPYKLSPGHEDKLYGGDIILVQITKDAVKTKLPVADSNISLTGRYFVITIGDKRHGVSKKIHDVEKRKLLEKLLKEYRDPDYGIVARTNAADEDETVLRDELNNLLERYRELMRKASFAKAKTLLDQEPPHYISLAKELPKAEIQEIVTDDEEIYEHCLNCYPRTNQDSDIEIRFYKDDYPLYKLYRMDHYYKEAMGRYVFLKSGGSLVIEQTEAMVVIDVNSGSVIKGKKNQEEIFYQMNREAVYEIARQLRLRNLSGIIMIDFINMKKFEQNKKIMDLLASECGRDRIRTCVVDMTGLGLVEVTRSKVLRPLAEQMKRME